MEKDGGVRKGYHCAWQIHYHIVFPVKYGKALLDGETKRRFETNKAVLSLDTLRSLPQGCSFFWKMGLTFMHTCQAGERLSNWLI